ncbi:hypothetical protein SR1949_26470 [Sphaerospermopsis reniformis]|uniref:DUF5678 domain-containing protein n=2 Tax=Sphaerospermopsis TaxID=752201 RepID=A0A480A129_9CYAN|nr:hypothetical protein NIES73_03270 [Sphaerospermopsis kisseleviana NIES-73]GCL37536.1 hypothetical protein SR1949_26470 [Sphaerospermopsis reniformis]
MIIVGNIRQYKYCTKAEPTMSEVKSTSTLRRGRIFPEIQWTQEQKAQWLAERERLYQRCKLIFDQVQPELIKTHYNWYIAVEPDSGEYFLNEDAFFAAQKAHEKYPNVKLHVFRINETGVCGRI